jgi:hypothetical protein
MSHFAQIDENNIVTQVIVVEQDVIDTGLFGDPSKWIQTSYNTRQNVHYNSDGLPSGKPPFRGNFAGIGYIYDTENDVFYSPSPFPSWILNTEKWTWESPVPYPVDQEGPFVWNEETLTWDKIEIATE